MAEGDNNGRDKTDVHAFPWYSRMWDFFGLNLHAVSSDEGEEDAGDKSYLEKLRKFWQDQFNLPGDRKERYRIFREMESFDMIGAILDVYAEESTQMDFEKKAAIWLESKHQHMIDAGKTCLQNIMAEDRLFGLTREMCLLGDQIRRNLYSPGKGILGWKYVDPSKVHRVEDKYDRLHGFREDGQTKFRVSKKESVSYAWDYVHFRLIGKDNQTQWGSSVTGGLYRPWRQLALLEDTDLTYQVRRSAERNAVMVDVGDMDEVEANERLRRVERKLKRHTFIDPASPQYKKNYLPTTPIEDVFLALRGAEDATRIEPMGTAGQPLQPERMDYYRNKLFGAAKVPKAYFGFEGEIDAKATLMQQDVRFARTMKRIQKALVYGFRNTLDIHFMLFDPKPEENRYNIHEHPYTVMMAPIAYLDEWERLELVQLRYSLIESMAGLGQALQIDATAWATYVLIHYAKLPENVVRILLRKGDTPEVPQPGGPFGGAPDAALGGNGNGQPPRNPAAESLRRKRMMLTEVEKKFGQNKNNTSWKTGFQQLTPDEDRQIAEAVHHSPLLRKIIGDIAEIHADDMDPANQQTDPSLLPPTLINTNGERILFEDTMEDEPEIKRLKEDFDKSLALAAAVVNEG